MRKREATSPPCSGYPFSRPPRHEGGAHMSDDRCRLGSDDVVIGLDLASAEHQAVVVTAAGKRLTRFRMPHTRAGLEDLLRRTTSAAPGARASASLGPQSENTHARPPDTTSCGGRWSLAMRLCTLGPKGGSARSGTPCSRRRGTIWPAHE